MASSRPPAPPDPNSSASLAEFTKPSDIAQRAINKLRADRQFLLDEMEDLWVFERGRMMPATKLWVQNWLFGQTSIPLSDYLIGLVQQNLKSGLGVMPGCPPEELVNFRNGLWDPKDGRVRPASMKEWPSPIQIPIWLDPEAKCPTWERFLGMVFPADAQEFALELIGSFLCAKTFSQTMTWCIGAGGNGKGTFIEAVIGLLGDENVFPITLSSLESSPFATYGLRGKLLVFHADVELTRVRESSVIKQITSRDPMRMEKKGQDARMIRPFAKMLIGANGEPSTADFSVGMQSRPLLVPFDRNIRGTSAERNRQELVAELMAEAPGLMNRVLPALQRAFKRGRLELPPSIVARTSEYRYGSHPMAGFALDHLETGTETDFISTSQMQDAYAIYRRRNGLGKLSAPEIAHWLARERKLVQARERRATDNGGARGWFGLRLVGLE